MFEVQSDSIQIQQELMTNLMQPISEDAEWHFSALQ
jgi:hypothetical protein